MGKNFGGYLLLLCVLFGNSGALAQVGLPNGQPAGTLNKPLKDTSKTNTNQWHDEPANVTFRKLNSARVYAPDTSLHTFHRQLFTQPWYRDLGNHGSPATNLLFTPEDRVGPTLGYHIYDIYRYDVDSLGFYNSTRPYSDFKYFLGSRLEQSAGIMHTQNIRPNWNFAVEYRKINSPGFYKVERNNHDNAWFTTNYKSLNKHYTLYGAMAYNKEQHDENGGIISSELSNIDFSDRRTIDARYQNDNYSLTRSSVSNVQRDFTLLLQHSYTWGPTDTTYNEDSTQYTYKLKPLFSITHKMEISTEKHIYKDLTPDSMRYTTLFNQAFTSNGTGYYAVGGDSVLTQQKWFWVDNKVLLNGFIGKEGQQLTFSAGLGNRYDQFISQPVSNIIQDSLPKQLYSLGLDRSSIVSNYFTGEIKKEALHPGQWEYGANARLYLTGQDAGDFVFDASFGRELQRILGSFVAGFRQQLNDAPYAYTNYENVYTKLFYTFSKESVTTLYATIESPRFRLSGGVRNHLINNYIYLDESEHPASYTIPFNIAQLWIRKVFRMGNCYLDNEFVYQQFPASAPVSIPVVMGRHQFSYEIPMFKRALRIATGIEVRYNSSYHIAGYDALLNRFFYQSSSTVGNIPEASIFVNFRIKRFRAFLTGDYLQQLLNHQNTILAVGTPFYVAGTSNLATPIYAGPDFTIRFGFSWPLVN